MKKIKTKINNILIMTLVFFSFITILSYVGVNIFITSPEKSFKKLDNLSIAYIKKGSGSPLLLVHDLNSSSADFNSVIGELSKRYTVIAIDLPGFGESTKPENLDYSINNLSYTCNKFMNSLGYKQYSVIGHGFGANISLELATYDNVTSSLLLAPHQLTNTTTSIPSSIADIIKNNYFYSLYKYKLNFFNSSNIDYNIFEENLKVNNTTSTVILNKLYLDNKSYDPVKNVKKTKAKLLIIYGTDNKSDVTTYNYNLFTLYPNSSFIKINNCKQNPHIEAKSIFLKEAFSFI
ncbi:alpha/beta hydrolase [Inconstantimicrobium mannanitabidum]|uniref:Uncharacterized protein n=1 Tax=Inconstantimicrobium mannanitabidum TaxID=1604901 RepID=A0ACB5RHW2_9CLOT|nr:alpha/beta hydrolase [Clostridium sp. TW13]GKX68700.1 hypothetical protein rsdtw13_39580 [Clostridium sp. TW13]